MEEKTQVVEAKKQAVGPVAQIKGLLNDDAVKKRFQEVLGKKAPQFMASIANVVSASPQQRMPP